MMKPVHEIINKIKWCGDTGEFIIGYWDRVEKRIRETSFIDFMKSEIPLHRIRVIKRGNKVVWKRQEKS